MQQQSVIQRHVAIARRKTGLSGSWGGGKRRRKGNVHDADAGAEAGPSWKETKQLDQANIRDGSTSSGALALGRPAASQVAKPSGFRGRMDVQGSMIQWIVGI